MAISGVTDKIWFIVVNNVKDIEKADGCHSGDQRCKPGSTSGSGGKQGTE